MRHLIPIIGTMKTEKPEVVAVFEQDLTWLSRMAKGIQEYWENTEHRFIRLHMINLLNVILNMLAGILFFGWNFLHVTLFLLLDLTFQVVGDWIKYKSAYHDFAYELQMLDRSERALNLIAALDKARRKGGIATVMVRQGTYTGLFKYMLEPLIFLVFIAILLARAGPLLANKIDPYILIPIGISLLLHCVQTWRIVKRARAGEEENVELLPEALPYTYFTAIALTLSFPLALGWEYFGNLMSQKGLSSLGMPTAMLVIALGLNWYWKTTFLRRERLIAKFLRTDPKRLAKHVASRSDDNMSPANSS